VTTKPLPPIDAHAHVAVTISPEQVRSLDALVIAVTSGRAEWEAVVLRQDELTLWAAGCHPNDRVAVVEFDVEHFRAVVEQVPVVGEVGLDGASPTDTNSQLAVFDAVLAATADRPRPITIHSRFACDAVLDCLEARPQAAPILHWWRGDETQTRRALSLGCYFSLNGAEAARPRVLDFLPAERVLTETDYPHSITADPAADRPAAVETIERALSEAWDTDPGSVRVRVWANLADAFKRADSLDELPHDPVDAALVSRPGQIAVASDPNAGAP
jgi:TatD DNase family protein